VAFNDYFVDPRKKPLAADNLAIHAHIGDFNHGRKSAYFIGEPNRDIHIKLW
jgi:hypothetical protein